MCCSLKCLNEQAPRVCSHQDCTNIVRKSTFGRFYCSAVCYDVRCMVCKKLVKCYNYKCGPVGKDGFACSIACLNQTARARVCKKEGCSNPVNKLTFGRYYCSATCWNQPCGICGKLCTNCSHPSKAGIYYCGKACHEKYKESLPAKPDVEDIEVMGEVMQPTNEEEAAAMQNSLGVGKRRKRSDSDDSDFMPVEKRSQPKASPRTSRQKKKDIAELELEAQNEKRLIRTRQKEVNNFLNVSTEVDEWLDAQDGDGWTNPRTPVIAVKRGPSTKVESNGVIDGYSTDLQGRGLDQDIKIDKKGEKSGDTDKTMIVSVALTPSSSGATKSSCTVSGTVSRNYNAKRRRKKLAAANLIALNKQKKVVTAKLLAIEAEIAREMQVLVDDDDDEREEEEEEEVTTEEVALEEEMEEDAFAGFA